jgi:hypothetical protein
VVNDYVYDISHLNDVENLHYAKEKNFILKHRCLFSNNKKSKFYFYTLCDDDDAAARSRLSNNQKN